MNIFQFFQPRDKKFFPLFERASSNVIETAKVLLLLVNSKTAEERRKYTMEIERLEHTGDSITHETLYELSKNFITPFDREDIHELISTIDDIVDYLHGSAKRIELYGLVEVTPPMIKLAELNLASAEALHRAVCELRNLSNQSLIKEATVHINSIENQADDVFDNAIASLFSSNVDAKEIIRQKDILAVLETATDKCEDAADVILSIMVKNA